jgi:hypothetical protein
MAKFLLKRSKKLRELFTFLQAALFKKKSESIKEKSRESQKGIFYF